MSADSLSLAAVPAAVGLVFLIAGFAKGVTGLGLPTVAIGLLGLFLPPAEAAALLVVPSLVTNLWQGATGPGLAGLLRRLWPMMLGTFAGTWAGTLAGTGLMAAVPAGRALLGLGIALALYAALGLASVRLRTARAAEPWLSPAMGAATGLVTAATGVFVIPAVPYLQSLALEKDALVQALGLSFTASTLALAAALAGQGLFEASAAGFSALALAPALAGMALGRRVRDRVPPAAFRRCFFACLLALGGHLVLRSLA